MKNRKQMDERLEITILAGKLSPSGADLARVTLERLFEIGAASTSEPICTAVRKFLRTDKAILYVRRGQGLRLIQAYRPDDMFPIEES